MRRGLLAVLMALPALAGCAAGAPGRGIPPACPFTGQTRQLRIELYFGLDRPDGRPISETEWRDFVAREVTPRFPDGLSELAAGGQWRDRVSNRIGHEPSRILLLVVPASTDLAARVEDMTADYRRLFDQQSVGVVSVPVCAGF